MKDRSDLVFISIVLSLVAGVPVALYSIYYFADSIQHIAAIFLGVIVVVSILGLILVKYKEQIWARISGVPESILNDITTPLGGTISNYSQGEYEAGNEELTKVTQVFWGHYTWMKTRQWIIATSAALLLGFAGLVGSALLKQQNVLIEEQNAFFREQINQQRQQLELQQDAANQDIRSEAIRRIYGDEFTDTVRVKAEALRSLVSVERLRILKNNNTLSSDFINLHEADLASAWLENADLQKVSFRDTNLSKANLNVANLQGSVFRFTDITDTMFMSANLENVLISFSDAHGARFAGANLNNANLVKSNFRSCDLSGVNLSNASLVSSNLEGADLDGIENWKQISSIEGTNVFGVRNPPEGFITWALAKGAINQSGALSDLKQQGLRYRVEFELDSNANP